MFSLLAEGEVCGDLSHHFHIGRIMHARYLPPAVPTPDSATPCGEQWLH
jgi:hypothetical protein